MKQLIILGFALAFLCSSCSMESETYITKNGGGSSAVTMDMGGMMGMMGGMGGMMGGEEGPDMGGENSVKDPMGKKKNEDFSPDDFMKLLEGDEKIDSTVNMYEVMPDSLKGSEYAKYMKNIDMRVVADKGNSVAKITMKMKYKDEEEYNNITRAFKKMEEMSDSGDKEAPPMEEMFSFPQVDHKRGIVVIPALDWKEMLGDDMPGGGMGLGGSDDEEDSEGAAMMAMMFGDAAYESTYHLPGKIEFTNMMDAKIDGNKVTFSIPMGDFMNEMKTPQYVIKYKS